MNLSDDLDIELLNSGSEAEEKFEEEEWGQSFMDENTTYDTYDGEEHKLDSCTPVERMKLNDHKAGMKDLDKEKINEIIYKASKGSKYYENEKRKEHRVKEKIQAMKVELDGYSKQDKHKALLGSDKIIYNLRQKIDLTRTLVHIDMDAFYAAVEMRDNPSLKDVPMAVGGNDMLCTSNYLARKFGVRAAMPGFIAKKLCPELKIVPLNFDKYRSVSFEIRSIFEEFDPNYAPMSLDEAYLDLTDYIAGDCCQYDTDQNSETVVELVVEEIRKKIFERTQLTASAGIAPNIMLSKICSDLNKPNGQYFLKADMKVIQDFIERLPIRKVFGIGKISEQMLKSIDISTCQDLFEKRDILYLLFSDTSFTYFMKVALGISENRIKHSQRKSMSVERTFDSISDKDTLLKICHNLCEQLSKDLGKEKLQGRNVTLKYKLSSFVQKTRSRALTHTISKTEEIYSFAKEILLHEINSCTAPSKFELRLMGIRMCQFTEKGNQIQNTVDEFFTSIPGPSTAISNWEKNDQKNIPKVHSFDSRRVVKKDGPKSTDTSIEIVSCPVCSMEVENNIMTLNNHIDQCLTKQTIRELVRSEAATPNVDSHCLPNSNNYKSKSKSKKRTSQDQIKNTNKKVTLFSFWKS